MTYNGSKSNGKTIENADKKVGAVLVIGAGIAGIQASLDLADSGFRVYLLDKSPSVGGVMPQLDKTFPTNDCAMCILAPKLVETGRHHNIQLILNADLEKVEGGPGDFKVLINKKARKVREDRCTGCGICTQTCPIEVEDEFNRRLKKRKAIYLKYPQSVPPTHTIDLDACIGCGICEHVCEAKAIEYTQENKKIEIDVGAIILSPGYSEYDPTEKQQYGYGRFPNVVTSLELERMLSATGPYGGLVLRPSDGVAPRKLAFLQCVGSRDREVHERYCSAVCCMFSIKEAIIAKEHVPGLEPAIFFMDMRAYGKEFDEYYVRAEEEHGIRFYPMRIADIEEDPKTHDLFVTYREWTGEIKREEFDMVVLSVGMRPPQEIQEVAKKLGIELNEYGFCKTDIFEPLQTSRPGIFVCGAFSVPKDIPDSVAQASGAACKASVIISSERNTMVEKVDLPAETDIKEGEEPRIGVFVCHCGINIGGIVNIPEVVEFASTLPNVVHVEHNLYTCSQDTQERIKKMIKEKNLNRVVVASCTPRTHGPMFRNTCREAGLNAYLFEMANIRDQCSWVHMTLPLEATEKAKDLVKMAIAKAKLLDPLKKISIDIKKSGLVIGGGLSGITAALELARQGFDAYLVEREEKLGGLSKRVFFGLGGEKVHDYMEDLIKELRENPKVQILTKAELKKIEGYIGNFRSVIETNGEEKEIEHGVVIVATGGKELMPNEYLYGKDPRVMTQLEFEEKMAMSKIDPKSLKTVVMVQCVGSRIPSRNYCSRVCCTETIKNALMLKDANPDVNIYILYKDMRTYGFREAWFTSARDKGIIFVKYDNDHLPEVYNDGDELKVAVIDQVINSKLVFTPDLVTLAVATLPADGTRELAKMLKVPLSKDGFYLEAHMKLRPLEFATDGIFLCGLAHAPKFIEECLFQASGAVSRAATILSRDKYEVEGIISRIDPELCIGCGTCADVCSAGAATMDPATGKAVIIEVLCKGCGVCVASCPKDAATAVHFTNDQLLAQVKAYTDEGKSDADKKGDSSTKEVV